MLADYKANQFILSGESSAPPCPGASSSLSNSAPSVRAEGGGCGAAVSSCAAGGENGDGLIKGAAASSAPVTSTTPALSPINVPDASPLPTHTGAVAEPALRASCAAFNFSIRACSIDGGQHELYCKMWEQ
jgi:hypothetical protein